MQCATNTKKNIKYNYNVSLKLGVKSKIISKPIYITYKTIYMALNISTNFRAHQPCQNREAISLLVKC